MKTVPILLNINTDPFLASKLILEGCFVFVLLIYILTNERNLQNKILKEIILILILKWYFKPGILHPHCFWILLIWVGFLIRGRDLSHVQSFIIRKSLLRIINSTSKKASLKKMKTPTETRLLTKTFLSKNSIYWVCLLS